MINKLSNIDMKDLYRELLCNYDQVPEILVFDELEDGCNISCHLMLNGRYIYHLKNDSSMIDTLLNQIDTPSCKTKMAFPFEYHRMEGQDIAKWIACACKISDILNIRCPQIMFSYDEDAGNFVGEGLLTFREIMDNCAYISVMSAQDPKSREYFQKLVGTRKVLKVGKSDTFHTNGNSSSMNVQPDREPVYQPEDFGNLNDHVVIVANGRYIEADKCKCYE